MTCAISGRPTTLRIPESHADLLVRSIVGVITTLPVEGPPRSSLVWVDHDGECARINTTLECGTGRDLLANPRLSLLVVDPNDTSRFIQIRGDGELVSTNVIQHLDELTRLYTSHPRFYGFVHQVAQLQRETRVICRIHARRITLDAIHA